MRVTGWLKRRSVRRRLVLAAMLGGCFTWAMVTVGLSFAMVDRGSPHWWVMPLFGAFVLAAAVLLVRADVPWAMRAPVEERPMVAERLSPRELEVLRELAAGRSNTEIAKTLFVSPGTVKAHLHHIYRKLEATSRLQAVAHAREAGLLE